MPDSDFASASRPRDTHVFTSVIVTNSFWNEWGSEGISDQIFADLPEGLVSSWGFRGTLGDDACMHEGDVVRVRDMERASEV